MLEHETAFAERRTTAVRLLREAGVRVPDDMTDPRRFRCESRRPFNMADALGRSLVKRALELGAREATTRAA